MVVLSRPLLFLRYSASLCAICLHTTVFLIIIAIVHHQTRLFFGHEFFSRTNEVDGVFGVVPRGGLRNLERFQRLKFLSRSIRYYSNVSCAFNPAVYKILRSGDVETNPGYDSDCGSSNASTRPRRQLRTSKLKVFYTNARSIVKKIVKL